MKIGIVIPAYNVEERLQDVLLKTLTTIPGERIFVVDDGSTDSTADVAAFHGVSLFKHDKNRGKGEALKTGFRLILKNGLDGVITLDGDGQHDPGDIPRFISIRKERDADLVLGSRRYRIGKMPLDRICSNRLSSLIVSLISGKWIPDSQSGYRLIRSSVLKDIRLFSDHYELESELLIKAIRMGCRVSFCPITVRYGEAGSHIRRFRDTKRFCQMILKLLGNPN